MQITKTYFLKRDSETKTDCSEFSKTSLTLSGDFLVAYLLFIDCSM